MWDCSFSSGVGSKVGAMKPAFAEGEVALHGGEGDVEGGGDLVQLEAANVAEFDGMGKAGVVVFELGEGFVDGEEVLWVVEGTDVHAGVEGRRRWGRDGARLRG